MVRTIQAESKECKLHITFSANIRLCLPSLILLGSVVGEGEEEEEGGGGGGGGTPAKLCRHI